MLKIKNLELVVPWSIEPTNSSELPISIVFEEVRETVTKSILLVTWGTREDAFICYLVAGLGLWSSPRFVAFDFMLVSKQCWVLFTWGKNSHSSSDMREVLLSTSLQVARDPAHRTPAR